MFKLWLKPKPPGSQTCVLSITPTGSRDAFPRISQNSGLWICQTKPCHPKGFSVFREGVSGRCQVPWSLEQLLSVCVWWFPEEQERMVIKSSGLEARLPEFKSIQVLHSLAVYLGQVDFLSFLLWYWPPWGCGKAPYMYEVLGIVYNKC